MHNGIHKIDILLEFQFKKCVLFSPQYCRISSQQKPLDSCEKFWCWLEPLDSQPCHCLPVCPCSSDQTGRWNTVQTPG